MKTIRSSALRPTRQIDDEDSEGHADLRRRQADAGRRIHRLDHVVDELLDVAGQLADVRRARRAAAASPNFRIGRITRSRSRRRGAAGALNLACSRSVAVA